MKKLFVLFAASVLLVGCAGSDNNQQMGALTGAVIGGLIGNQVGSGGGRAAMTIGGALIGSHIGRQIGRDFDEQTNHHIYHALDEVPKQRSRSWSGTEGERFTLTPTHTYRHQGKICRRFKLTIIHGEQVDVIHGKACRERVGHWEWVDER